MPIYSYKGRGRDRQLIEGSCENPTLEEAISFLNEQGITLIDIKAKENSKSLSALLNLNLTKPTIKIQEMIIFCRQMYTLTKAGISLVISIRRLREISRNETFRDTLHGIERSILAGQSFGSCLRRYSDVFSPLFIELVSLGEESGKLDEAFLNIGNYLTLDYETRKRFKAAVRYPTMVLVAILSAIIIINLFVIPNFAKLYSSFHTQLPLPTILMIKFSNFLRHSWMYLLGGTAIIIFFIRNYLKTTAGRLFWDHYQFKLPIIGQPLERIVLSRFARTMAIVFSSGVPLERGIALVSGAVGNTFAKQRIATMEQHIKNGENLSRAAAGTHLFSPLTLQMISVGEETGAMETMFTEIAIFYEREVDYDLESLGDKIEPVLLIVVASMVLMLAIAVFLPMWDIYKFAQGGH